MRNYPKNYTSKTKNLAKFSALLNSTGSAVIGILAVPLITNYIGFSGYGQWATIFIAVGLSIYFELGIPKQLTQEMAGQEDAHLKTILWNHAYGILLAKLLIFVVVLWILFFAIKLVLSSTSSSLLPYIVISGGCILLASLSIAYCRGFMEGMCLVHIANLYSLFQTCLIYLTAVLVALLTESVKLAVTSTAVAYLVVAALMLVHVNYWSAPRRNIFKLEEQISLMKRARNFYWLGICNGTTLPACRLMVSVVDPTGISHAKLDICLKIGLGGLAVLNSFTTHLHGQLAAAAKNVKNISPIVYRQTITMSAIYAAGAVLYTFLGPYLLNTIGIPRDFFTSLTYLLVLTIALTAIGEPCIRALWATNNVQITTKIKIYQLAISLVLPFILPLKDPFSNVAISLSFAFTITTFYTFFVYHASDQPDQRSSS